MTDYSRDRLGPDDEDRLPWLEPVEEELEEEGGISSRLIILLVVGLLLVAAIIGGFLWMRSGNDAGSGEGALINAPDAYYKERPAADAPDSAEDEIVYSASKGNEVESVIDTSGTAETPVNVDRAQVAEAPAPAVPPPTVTRNAPAAAPKATAPAAPATPTPVAKAPPKPAAKPTPAPAATPAPSGGGSGTIQLGAFSSQAKANAAWKNLAGRFSFLSGLTQSVVPVQSGDKTLYRLRASGGDARDICGRLRTAGESCSVIG
jgi:cell division septation protein DedD